MDKKTLDYYKNNANEMFKRYENASEGIDRFFRMAFPPESKVLDIGAGSGRDTRKLIAQGYDAIGIEPCHEFIELALKYHPELSERLFQGSLPDLDEKYNEKFDGVLCSAVLMHIPKENLFDTAFSFKRVLKPGGYLLISLPGKGPKTDNQSRDENGRLCHHHSPEYLQLLFERVGFQLNGSWETEDGMRREDRTWIVQLYFLKYSAGIRPIEQIESILNRDRKVATYKLALFRALCEISISNYNQVIWENNGMIGIPVDLIAEKWIYYYWPLIESSQFIPQIYGEKEDGGVSIAFRNFLKEMIDLYHLKGGLSGFTLDLKSSSFDLKTEELFHSLLQAIKETIIRGPVIYSGSSIKGVRAERMFSYHKKDRTVRLKANIFREISLMSKWLLDTIVLRWAELTSKMSKNSITPG
jgi:SAM-dependent methyltransferase